jgi:hypothetical protein
MSLGRIERCFTDNIYLIESLPEDEDNPYERSYIIMGNSGRTYTVTISHRPKCTCPDFRSRANRCKHIFFVLIRIMNVSNFQDKTYSEEELEEMFENIPEVAKNLIYQGKLPSQQEEVNQKFDKDDICPICLDPLENGKELDYCKYSCGKTIHKKCFSMWEKSKGGICVFCRGQWYSDFPKIKPKKVSMHPIVETKADEENKNSNNIENTKVENTENKCEKISIENKENNKNKEEVKVNKEIKIDEKTKNSIKLFLSRNTKKSKSKSKERKKSMSINNGRSRSRSRSKSERKNKINNPEK